MARNKRYALDPQDVNLILAGISVLHDLTATQLDGPIVRLASAQRMNQIKIKLGVKPKEITE